MGRRVIRREGRGDFRIEGWSDAQFVEGRGDFSRREGWGDVPGAYKKQLLLEMSG